jgi:beta-phosphoglucomutase
VPSAVVSNAEPENIAMLLDGAGLRRYFPTVVDGHQVQRPKPFPDIYLRAGELLNVPASGCVVFEDSVTGITAGVAAKMRVVGLRTTLTELPPVDLAIDDFTSTELRRWLDGRG